MSVKIITNCFKDQPELKNKLDNLWTVLTNVNEYLSLRSPTNEQVEWGAKECDKCLTSFSCVLSREKSHSKNGGSEHGFTHFHQNKTYSHEPNVQA